MPFKNEEKMISVVIPTYNEKGNLPVLINSIFNVFNDLSVQGEVIIVDDNSPDGTGDLADEIMLRNNNIKVIHRKGKMGLSSAVIEGFKNASNNIIGVMDADMSHPPEIIPELVRSILENQAEFVVASRYLENNKIEKWPLSRKIISKGATILAKPLTYVSDPMSGFFFFKKEIIDGVKLSPVGYKIMLEIIVKGNYCNIEEVPFTFRDRNSGESKLNWKEHFNYLHHLIKLYLYILKKNIETS